MPASDTSYEEVDILWGDIQPGDILPDGSEVTQVHEVQLLKAYRFEFSNGESYDVSWDHIFKTDVKDFIMTMPSEQALQIKRGLEKMA